MLGTKELRQDRFCAHDRRLPPVVVAPLEHVTESAALEFTTFIAFYQWRQILTHHLRVHTAPGAPFTQLYHMLGPGAQYPMCLLQCIGLPKTAPGKLSLYIEKA